MYSVESSRAKIAYVALRPFEFLSDVYPCSHCAFHHGDHHPDDDARPCSGTPRAFRRAYSPCDMRPVWHRARPCDLRDVRRDVRRDTGRGAVGRGGVGRETCLVCNYMTHLLID